LKPSKPTYCQSEIDSPESSDAILSLLADVVGEGDPGLNDHCQRLVSMATAMAEGLGLTRAEIVALRRAGYLHDIGKIEIPKSILFKPGPLSAEEWAIMKTHPERGERICRRVKSLSDVLPAIRHHHEKWDGTGYPDGLKGVQIPLLARIIQIADIYDALTTERSYKPAFTAKRAVEILKQEAEEGWRDPKLVDLFVRLVPEFEEEERFEEVAFSLQALSDSISHFGASGQLIVTGELQLD
jgi:putative two-component system response regulator